MISFPMIQSSHNPYRDNVQGKANEPICVAGLLDRSKQILSPLIAEPIEADWTLEEVYRRLEVNAPRVAIIGGSGDHPAHIMDYQTISWAALRIWRNGGIPFSFATPVMCDGTAQNNQGMSYSLQSRNAVAQMVVNQMESHSYHGAFVIQGCDKQPLGVVSALGHLDRVRRLRGEPPVFATFAPAHVLQGGTIPEDLWIELAALAEQAESAGETDVAYDLKDAMGYILQCSSNTAFQGVFERARDKALITAERHKYFEQRLAVATCDGKGGICAFNGTGNSSRHLVAALGLVHPALELLTSPPEQAEIDSAIDCMASMINNPVFGVANLLAANVGNAIRIHSASGGSTNLMMHLVAGMVYAGYKFDLWELDRIHNEVPVPDLFDYSLTQGRDIFALAKQCCSGQSRGMETLFHELLQNGVPMQIDAPTVTGHSWRERLSRTAGLSALGVKDNPIILSEPRRPFSGVDVLKGNFFESAVVKISGMTTAQLDSFDNKAAFVLYFENEDEANRELLQADLLDKLRRDRVFRRPALEALANYNAPDHETAWQELSYDELFDELVDKAILKLALIIAGQGPVAFGMPEMFTPMQHINASRKLRRVATLISDGRYSGVTYGAAIGHMTPEAFEGGGILFLQTGDLLHMNFRGREMHVLDEHMFLQGQRVFQFEGLRLQRQALAKQRLTSMQRRQKFVAAANRIKYHTDAAHGVVPLEVWDDAALDYKTEAILLQHDEVGGV